MFSSSACVGYHMTTPTVLKSALKKPQVNIMGANYHVHINMGYRVRVCRSSKVKKNSSANILLSLHFE